MNDIPSSEKYNWDEYFARTATPPELSKIKAFIDLLPSKPRILDYGCGTGRFSAAFASAIADVTIDVIDQHLDKSIHISEQWNGIRYQQRFEDFAPEFSYDGIWAHAVLFLLPKPAIKQQFSMLSDALKPNAVFGFSLVEECESAVQARFTGMHMEDINNMLHENNLHTVSFEKTENSKYGKQMVTIPTFNLIVRKRT